jgi:hypothetical protein
MLPVRALAVQGPSQRKTKSKRLVSLVIQQWRKSSRIFIKDVRKQITRLNKRKNATRGHSGEKNQQILVKTSIMVYAADRMKKKSCELATVKRRRVRK